MAISGSTGFVGSALVSHLLNNGVDVIRLVRRGSSNAKPITPQHGSVKDVFWDPESDFVDLDAFDAAGVDAVVHLAGENVHQHWNESAKRKMINSRVRNTELLARAMLGLKKRPRTFISASGISFYHSLNNTDLTAADGRPVLDESSAAGTGFLAELCQEWERASRVVDTSPSGFRVVNLRIGVVLGPSGGVLKRLVPLFRWGLGGRWGSGLQHMSWIGIYDLVRIIHFVLVDETITGPVNAVAPTLVTNREFAILLAKSLSRPAVFNVPGWLLRTAFGKEWVDSTLLADYRVRPAVLTQKGFKFMHSELESFLQAGIGQKSQ